MRIRLFVVLIVALTAARVGPFASHAPATTATNLILNGDFSRGLENWIVWPQPNFGFVDASTGRLHFHRVQNFGSLAILQPTGMSLPRGAFFELSFELGNTDTVPKRLSVIVHDQDWSDLQVCTFTLEPMQPLLPYVMRAQTTEHWIDAAVGFFAITGNPQGAPGDYVLDTVEFTSLSSGGPSAYTECVDPLAPTSGGVEDVANLITNGDFATGSLTPWQPLSLRVEVVPFGSDFAVDFHAAFAAGALLQSTGVPAAQHQRIVATFDLGNLGSGRQRVRVDLHDADFSDVALCHFWLPAGMPPSPFVMTAYATKPWTNITVSFVSAGLAMQHPAEFLRLDNVQVRRTTGATPGTQCVAPSAIASRREPTAAGLLAR